ncbi:uncharacterized protein LOC114520670 [Dendronephthya gigantea]|uniref:uncharacterized protein LOC114520670 n=1 Tax=Dendronephthya gigantea TaxID=151771 RepID=UPI00106A3E61|nr:uncharacterized protein LOC114520670 [Dendronephthya gigantea]
MEETYQQAMDNRNEGENLLLRKTQGDLLQKLRQLQQWRQQKEEHLLQDKEKQMSLLRDKEKRLQAVQEYQRRILQNNNLVTSGIDNATCFPVEPPSFNERLLPRGLVEVGPVAPGLNYSKNVLLSPQHFTATSANMVKSSFLTSKLMPVT